METCECGLQSEDIQFAYCGHRICNQCYIKCGKCLTTMCMSCRNTCQMCTKDVCECCAKMCKKCGDFICKKETCSQKCKNCDTFSCRKCNMVFIKEMPKAEFDIFMIANKLEICPSYISHTIEKDGIYTVKMVCYPKTLEDCLEQKQYFPQIQRLINLLHKNEILHGDLHLGNIVIDKNDNVKLIDFGMSLYFESVKNPDNLNVIASCKHHVAKTLEDLIFCEINMCGLNSSI